MQRTWTNPVGLEFWANISAVWLALLCFIGLLIPLAAAYFAIRVHELRLGQIPRRFRRSARLLTHNAPARVDSLSQKIAKPVIKVESEVAKAEEVMRTLAQRPER